MKNKISNTRKARHFLYALLVTCVFCGLEAQGQDTPFIKFDIDTINPVKLTKEQLPIVLQIMIEYKEDCYNDSTKQINGYGQVTCYPMNPPIYKYEFYDTVYVHKTPTFDGFLQWFSKKYAP